MSLGVLRRYFTALNFGSRPLADESEGRPLGRPDTHPKVGMQLVQLALPSRMISQSKASEIAAEVIDAGRRDRAWRNGFTRPLPYWFRGAHLAGLSDYERHAKFNEMSRRALKRPGWVVVGLLSVAAILIPSWYFAKLPLAAISMWPAIGLMYARHNALRRQFKLDARAAASNEQFVGSAGESLRDSA